MPVVTRRESVLHLTVSSISLPKAITKVSVY